MAKKSRTRLRMLKRKRAFKGTKKAYRRAHSGKKKIVAVVKQILRKDQELKKIMPDNTVLNPTTVANYQLAPFVGGDITNNLYSAFMMAGYGYAMQGAFAGSMTNYLWNVGNANRSIATWDPSAMTITMPQQGLDENNRIGNRIRLREWTCKWRFWQCPSYYWTTPGQVNSDAGDENSIWIVQWEPVRSHNDDGGAFVANMTTLSVATNPDFVHWHNGVYVDWVRDYKVRPTKKTILKFPTYKQFFGNVNGGAQGVQSVFGGPDDKEWDQPKSVTMGKRYKGIGKDCSFTSSASRVPDSGLFFVTVFIKHPSAFYIQVSHKTLFYDS